MLLILIIHILVTVCTPACWTVWACCTCVHACWSLTLTRFLSGCFANVNTCLTLNLLHLWIRIYIYIITKIYLLFEVCNKMEIIWKLNLRLLHIKSETEQSLWKWHSLKYLFLGVMRDLISIHQNENQSIKIEFL